MDMKQYQKENAEIQYKHRYWGFQIATYLFLGGLGGGILFLSWVLTTFVFPGTSLVQAFMLPNFIALLAIVLGLFFLVEELGQPPVFYRAYVTATSIIKWGAVLLTIASFGDLFWLLGNWSPEVPILGFLSVFNFLGGLSSVWLGAAGIAGFGIMVYTGVMLSTLKAHSFWSTPALPILFTTSALSTACAGIMLSLCGWPGVAAMSDLVAAHHVHELLHVLDIILGFAELTILLVMVLSFLGAGNRTQQRVAQRWVKGSYAGWFWIGMIGLGLVVPLIMNASGNAAAGTIACILVLCGGCLLRFLCVWSDDRQPLEGENKYYFRQKHSVVDYSKLYVKPAKEMDRGQTFEYIENMY